MVDLGYESHNAILNLGSVMIFIVIYILELFLYLGLKIYNKVTGKAQKWINKLHKKLFFSEILTLFIEAYLEFLIAGYLNVATPVQTT